MLFSSSLIPSWHNRKCKTFYQEQPQALNKEQPQALNKEQVMVVTHATND